MAPRPARTLAPIGLTPTQFGVLVELDNTPGTTSSELARRCLMAPQRTAEPLPTLETAGYVDRPSRGRGRPVPVHLTDEGRAILAEATPLVADADLPGRLGLDPDEVAAVTDDGELRRARYLLVQAVDVWLVIPGGFAALVTGVVLSLVTP